MRIVIITLALLVSAACGSVTPSAPTPVPPQTPPSSPQFPTPATQPDPAPVPPPVAQTALDTLSLPNVVGQAYGVVTFQAVVVGPTPYNRFDWVFGDGVSASSFSPTVTHQYKAAGTYRVQVTMLDGYGRTISAEATASVR